MNDLEFAKLAVEMSKQSYEEGAFPAGAVIVRNGEIIAKNTSAKYPKINFHAESKTIDEAINIINDQLTDCTLYCSMEPCLMCLSRAYWSGIRRIIFVVKKEKVDHKLCYESDANHSDLVKMFNADIDIKQIPELEDNALEYYKLWLNKPKLDVKEIDEVNNDKLMILHKYFIWSDRMRVHFDFSLTEPTPTTPEEKRKNSIEITMYMSLWYGMFYAVIEGWRDFNFHNKDIDTMLESSNVELLRRYRNGVFHVQNQYNAEKFETLYEQGENFPIWIRELRDAFSKYFLDTIRNREQSKNND